MRDSERTGPNTIVIEILSAYKLKKSAHKVIFNIPNEIFFEKFFPQTT